MHLGLNFQFLKFILLPVAAAVVPSQAADLFLLYHPYQLYHEISRDVQGLH